MTGGMLYEHHRERSRSEEKRRFALFLAAQFMHYGALLLLVLGGLFFIVMGLRFIL
jgi:hypothetical protein